MAVMCAWFQLPTDFHCVRRHSAGGTCGDTASTTASVSVRRHSFQPALSKSATVTEIDDGFLDAAQLGCRRRSFLVTSKGDVVNEGDEILPRQGY